MFIIHLVPLVLGKIICMQEISQKWTKDMHRRQVDMVGGHVPIGPCWPMPSGITRRPYPPCHVTDPWEGPHTASPALIHVGLIQRWKLRCLGSMGPLPSTWRGQTDLLTALLAKATDLPACNSHPEAIHHRWMQRRCSGRSADAPASPLPHCCLQVPPALYTL